MAAHGRGSGGGHCHARDNQSHPRPKHSPSPSHPAPLPSRLLQIAEITRVSLLRNPYVIQHHLASPQPNLEHLKTLLERIQPHATNLAISPACPGLCRSTRLLENSLYLVPFHLCTLLFSFSAYHCPVPTLYLSLYLLCLVV